MRADGSVRRRGAVVVLGLLAAALSASLIPPSVSAAVPVPAVSAVTPTAAIRAEARPLLIVLDTSSSMSEDDGTGTIKLAGAQAALSQVIRNQRPGVEIGLWAFPNAGDCGPGRSVIDMGPLDQRTMIAQINSVTASGNTPTGTALRAAVDSIKGQYDGATVLLISDGLHTCDPDPCEVAKEIRAEGFDLTVFPAGFKTSPEGMAELQCIADATGGDVYEADNADQLNEITTSVTTTELTVDVAGIPPRVPAGSARTVTVTVTNETAQDVANARIQFTFANKSGKGDQLIPSVLPPRVELGLVPAGATMQRSWLVSFGTPGRTGTAKYRVTAWGSNSQPVSKDGEVRVIDAVQTLSDAGGVIGSLQGKRVAILGDSYSSGEGAGDYESGTLSKEAGGNGCHHSRNTYLAPLFQAKNLELLACSGATSHYIPKTDNEDTNGVQEEQVWRLKEAQEKRGPLHAAFMTIGGNDIGFKDIIIACVAGHPTIGYGLTGVRFGWDTRCSDDANWTRSKFSLIDNLDHDLKTTYRMIYNELNRESMVKKRDGHHAPLYVLTYPQVFSNPQYISWCPTFDSHEVQFANTLVDRLNARIESSVRDLYEKEQMRIYAVTATQDALLPDNTMCPRPSKEPYINPIWDPKTLEGLKADGETRLRNFIDAAHFWGDGAADSILGEERWNDPELLQERVHPNAKGYQAETNALIAWSVGNEEEPPAGKDWKRVREDGVIAEFSGSVQDFLTAPLPMSSDVGLDLQGGSFTGGDLNLRAGQNVELKVSGGAPDSTATISVHSSARILANVLLDEEGRGSVVVTLPRDLEPGRHHLEATGFKSSGEPVLAAAYVDVSRAFPGWFFPALLGTSLLVLAGGLVLRRGLTLPRAGSAASIDR